MIETTVARIISLAAQFDCSPCLLGQAAEESADRMEMKISQMSDEKEVTAQKLADLQNEVDVLEDTNRQILGELLALKAGIIH